MRFVRASVVALVLLTVSGTFAGTSWTAGAATQDAPGQVDTTFGNGGKTVVGARLLGDKDLAAVATDETGAIFMTGTGWETAYVFKVKADGAVDATWGSGGALRVPVEGQAAMRGLARRPDDTFVMAGNSYHVIDTGETLTAHTEAAVRRITPQGATAAWNGQFIPGDNAPTRAFFPEVVATRGTTTYIAGNFRPDDGRGGKDMTPAVIRRVADGSRDSTFGESGVVKLPFNGFIHDLTVQPDGKVVVAGSYVSSGRELLMVSRLTFSGALDTTFSGDGIAFASTGSAVSSALRDVAIGPNGRIAGVGWDGASGPAKGIAVALLPNGSFDTSFDGNGMAGYATISDSHGIEALGFQADGNLVVGGQYGEFPFVARLTTSGQLDRSFGTAGVLQNPFNAEGGVTQLLIQPDGKPVAVGWSSGLDKTLTADPYPTVFRLTEPLPTVGSAPTSMFESKNLVFPIQLSKPSLEPVTVTATTSNGSAIAGLDYQQTSVTVTIAPGATTSSVTVPIFNDSLDEPDEQLNLTLTSGRGAVVDPAVTGTIVDDDPPPG